MVLEKLLQQLNWLSVNEMLQFRDSVMAYKCANNLVGSISAAFSSLVYFPPREFGGGARAPFPNSGW